MGVFRKISSKFKNIEGIIEELDYAGLAKDEIDLYKDIREINEKDLKNVNKLNKKLDKPMEKLYKSNKKIENIEKRMKKIKEKVRIPCKFEIIKICFLE